MKYILLLTIIFFSLAISSTASASSYESIDFNYENQEAGVLDSLGSLGLAPLEYLKNNTTSFLSSFLSPYLSTANAATLSLSPPKSSVPVGGIFSVDILLDTTGADTDGVDIKYLNFDPTFLEVQKVLPGILYPSTQSNTYDNTEGTIDFSQITTGGSTYNGSGILATVTFKVKSAGKAMLTFNFEPGNTTDTNVASAGVDVLTDADGGKYKLGSGQGFFSRIIDFFRNLFSFSS